MTHKERFLAALENRSVDMHPRGDELWTDTKKKYVKEGFMDEDEDEASHFDMSFRRAGWINSVGDMDFEERIIEEDESTKLVLNGNGARLRYWKNATGTPEHLGFSVQDRKTWDELIKPHLLQTDERRIPFDDYREEKRKAGDENRAFLWNGVAPFEQMHPVCGHEYMLLGMAMDPDWVKDMVTTYADFTIRHLNLLFDREGIPDAMWYFEDMGFKERPFMSPEMYEQIVEPGHAKLFEHSHSLGLKVIIHSCGFVEPLVPGLIDAGMDCLQAMEVKAGMDMPRLAERFGGKISFCGNIDIRVIASNDRKAIDAELEKKIPPVLDAGSGYILYSDHSIPPEVEHDTLKYFFERGAGIHAR